ncbi:IkappaB kinase complex, IKAP component [Myriangium duriaei CBS 260.36]|uniref:Elongator complex protein 1 n=1 Tax=Myriangium duriaei CBS 260.36 TaxID=1168546 RepID=A0A9P4J922_9PEZI|nr:IkappaB kinase complex, IKAP component [Myriangium duriaei CBS 260.36]
MRNLKNIRHTRLDFSTAQGLPLSATAWDADTDALICAFGPTEENAVIDLKRFESDAVRPEDGKLIASWDAPCPLPDLRCDRILSLKYFSETQSACLILEGGDLVVVREAPQQGEDLIEIVGSVDAGITAAAWSPDDELVAISTRADTFLLMTRLFESTANTQMVPEDVKVSAHVSVGWGKRETQFQGKRAKALRDPTIPEHIDEGTLSPHDDGCTSISWRGDGAFVAINTIEEAKRRMIRVYSREGVLDSVSEPVDGLESAISWRPAGNLIAGIQHRSDRVDVVFFERNGLRHGEFTLRLESAQRPDWATGISLAWNNDSTVLAVSFKDRLQLWTMGNYHYYLKQEISFPAPPFRVGITWHQEKALILAATDGQDLALLGFSFAVAAGPVLPPYDLGLAIVVDGTVLKLTPLRLANVPPPMALLEVALALPAIDVCTNEDGSQLAVLHTDAVAIYALQLSGPEPPAVSLSTTIPLDFTLFSHPRQIAMDISDIFVLNSTTDEEGDEICLLDQGGQHSTRIPLEGPAISLTPRVGNRGIAYQSTSKSKSEVRVGWISEQNGDWVAQSQLSLPAVCPRFEAWNDEDVCLVFGLTATGTLYAYGQSSSQNFSQRLQVRGVTSFLVTSAHLIFTTTQHLVKFVHLSDGELQVPLDEPEKDERCRSIERGGRLVTVMPSTYSLVLQMPRGNLETIYPRALVLAGIRKAIIAKNYRKAFFACRNHRVDMNILHDYSPTQFMDCVSLFVDQVKKPVHIDLFLSQLREEDVTETLYKETLDAPKLGLRTEAAAGTLPNGHTDSTDNVKTSKVNHICDGFLKALDSRRATHLQNVVTSHVCKSPPDLPAGLRLVAELRLTDPSRVDQAVEHICFLADVNRLYDAALGIYDLDVALLVAQQSQKDPREYLPYLQALQQLPDLRRRFTIDNDLKRHDKALAHLHALDSFDELKVYTEKHELYTQAMELHKYSPTHLNALMRLYADFLSLRNRFKEAGIAYEYLSDYSSASDVYLSAQLWRECLSTAQLSNRSPADIHSLALSLAEGLIESKDHTSAAQIYTDYLSDPASAAHSWCRAHRYDEAIRVVSRAGQPQLLAEVIDPGLAEGFATLSELLAEMKGQLGAQIPRLRELRVKKAADPLNFFSDAPHTDNPDLPDDVSVAASTTTTSAGTFMTRYTSRTGSTLATNTTRRTGKNRRREERKRARGKKGSVYEEEYLVSSIGRLVERLNTSGEEVGRLVEGLLRRGMRERAVAVGQLMRDVRAMAEGALPEVYEVVKREEMGQEGEEVQEGKKEMPVLKKFEGLSLLG